MEFNINEAFGWTASCISIILYFSPLPVFFKLCKGKLRYNETPNFTAILNYIAALNWFIYGYLLRDLHIIVGFMVGSIFSLLCIITYIIFLSKMKFTKALFTALILFTLTLVIYFLFAVLISNKDVIGYVCVVCSIICSFEPILVIKKVVKFRNFKFIPIKLCVLALVGSTCWVIYGFMIINFQLIIPNFVRMVFSLILMFIWNIFKKRKPIMEEVANYSITTTTRGNKTENSVTVV